MHFDLHFLYTKNHRNRNFWQTIVLLFTKKASKVEKIILNDAEKYF